MNYIVIGAGGFLGSYLIRLLEKQKHRVIATARNINDRRNTKYITWVSCDVNTKMNVDTLMQSLVGGEPWTVLYLAACHHPDVVQREPRMAWNTNITALSYFINALPDGITFYYPSTDAVYGEGSVTEKFSETARLAPVNLYGKHKALAEQIVLTYGHHVVRYPFLIGTSLCPQKKHFFDVIRETVAEGKPIDMFADSYRSALSFHQAAKYLIALTQMDQSQVPPLLNIASDDILSKYDIGKQIAKLYGLDVALVHPITIAHAEGIFKAPRASTTLIDNTLLKQTLGIHEIHLELEK